MSSRQQLANLRQSQPSCTLVTRLLELRTVWNSGPSYKMHAQTSKSVRSLNFKRLKSVAHITPAGASTVTRTAAARRQGSHLAHRRQHNTRQLVREAAHDCRDLAHALCICHRRPAKFHHHRYLRQGPAQAPCLPVADWAEQAEAEGVRRSIRRPARPARAPQQWARWNAARASSAA